MRIKLSPSSTASHFEAETLVYAGQGQALSTPQFKLSINWQLADLC